MTHRRTKHLSLLLLAVLVLGLFAGCAANNDTAMDRAPEMNQSTAVDAWDNGTKLDYDGMELYTEAPLEMGTSGSGQTQPVTPMDQKLIKTVYIYTETEELDAFLSGLDAQIAGLMGYVESREIYNGSSYSGGNRYRRASLTVRIPADKLGSFVASVEGESNVTEYTENVDDVTATYVDIDSRLKALNTEYDRLMVLLEKADNMADLLTIEERMTHVRYEIESVTSQLRVYDNKIAYSTVHLSINEVREYTVVEEETVWQRIAGGFKKSITGLWNFLVNLFVLILVGSPYLLLIGGIIVVVIILVRRKRKKKKELPQP